MSGDSHEHTDEDGLGQRPERGWPLDTLRGMTELATTVLGILRNKKTITLTVSVNVQDKG